MDDLTFSAKRASAGASARPEPADLETRFRSLVQSPLRAGILRYLSARPGESFDVEALMQTFGRLRMDVENCVKELADFGVAFAIGGTPVRYIAARPTNDALVDLLDQFMERRATVSSEDQSPSVQRFREMIGRDEKMLIVFEWIRTAAKSDISVLVLGPTGSGKELVARMIHELSRRSVAKFQAVNCAALPDTLFESEIFGYEKGAFTGAHDRKPGRLELAHEGTLFLDEIGDMSLMAQAKLLRVLEERRFERLGGSKSIAVDFRLISATNRPLEQFVRDGRFRAALSAPGRAIRAQDIEFLHAQTPTVQQSGDRLPSLAEAERAHIVRVLEAVDWNKKEAARVLDISRGTLYRKIVEYELEPEAKPAGRRGRDVEA